MRKKKSIQEIPEDGDGRTEQSSGDPYIYTRAQAAAEMLVSPSLLDKYFQKKMIRRVQKMRFRRVNVYFYHAGDVEKLKRERGVASETEE